ncbi:uncharacterized abhydrolase domain-containing protein DDB_G0269086 isoform X1 [Bacillus rossius redtenbacheri]|uniref:uncharacterized abhydrolase domain-containing protein DDB_G0269086 isoform X1 n=1 Tax=Bacillus rossius redtenbacheri TaxID=93214 RepID=UPI002FDE2BA7
MAVEFGTGKTVLILATVVGCFAVLWPKLFYPMLLAALSQKPSLDSSQACCDVIFENDVNAIKIVVEMCGNILHQYDDVDPKLTRAFEEGRLSKDVVRTCRNEVLSKCGVDITAFLEERVRLGHTYRQILDEIRSFNSSVCLKTNFGVAPALLGAPRHMRGRAPKLPSHFRQERLPHARPEMIHPALRERGRAIPQPHVVPRVPDKEGKPVPVAGIRPPMGGAGHVVPAPKGTGTMGIIMPIYTVGIVVFFMYTIMKVMFKKPSSGPGSYPEYGPDPEFRKLVFEEEAPAGSGRPTWRAGDEPTKLVATAISGLLAEADQQRDWLARRAELDVQVLQAEKVVPEAAAPPTTEPGAGGERDSAETAQVQEEVEAEAEVRPEGPGGSSSAQVQVVNMELTASCEGGQRWSRPATPVPRPATPVPPTPSPEPPAIFLEGALPSQSQLLVADSATRAVLSDDEDAPVVLSGKMTLSLIGLDHDQHPELDCEGDAAPRVSEQASAAGPPTHGADETDVLTPDQWEARWSEVEEDWEVEKENEDKEFEAEREYVEEKEKGKHEAVTEKEECMGKEFEAEKEKTQMQDKLKDEELKVELEVEKEELEAETEDVVGELELLDMELKTKNYNKEEDFEDKEFEIEKTDLQVQDDKSKEEKEMKIELGLDLEKEKVEGNLKAEVEDVVKELKVSEVEVRKEAVNDGDELLGERAEAEKEEVGEEEMEDEEELEEVEEEYEDEPVATEPTRRRQDVLTGVSSEDDSLQTAKETASEAVDEQEEDEEEVEEVDEDGEDIIPPPPLSNAVNCADEAPTTTVTTTTNYTTASAAAEATSTAGPEETAADLSALESIDPDDPDDELGDEEEVWNGDMDSEEEEESSEEEEVGPHVAASAQTPHRQHDR